VASRQGILGGLAVGGLLVAALAVGLVQRSRADVDLTVDPAMTRGAPGARITIVEFSDYQ